MNDQGTLERAIAYCKGQAMHHPDCAADRAYDRGVAACVRILEDMLPRAQSGHAQELDHGR